MSRLNMPKGMAAALFSKGLSWKLRRKLGRPLTSSFSERSRWWSNADMSEGFQ